MPAPRKYRNELRERVIRLFVEAPREEPELSLTAAVKEAPSSTPPSSSAAEG
jgi:hypothetical protein